MHQVLGEFELVEVGDRRALYSDVSLSSQDGCGGEPLTPTEDRVALHPVRVRLVTGVMTGEWRPVANETSLSLGLLTGLPRSKCAGGPQSAFGAPNRDTLPGSGARIRQL